MIDTLAILLERVEARVAAIGDDGPDDRNVRSALAEMRADLNITPTFLERRREAQTELRATVAEFQQTSELYRRSDTAWRQIWRDFFVGEYKPQMTRALQDLMGAQIREHIEQVIPRLKTLQAALVGLRAQRGDFS